MQMNLWAGHVKGRASLRHHRTSRWGIAVLIIAGLVVGVAAFGTSTLEVYRLEREAAELDRTKHQLQEQNAILHEEIKLLHTPDYIEKIAREQLGLVRPGEVAFLIVHAPAAPPTVSTQAADQASWATGIWQTLRRIFGR